MIKAIETKYYRNGELRGFFRSRLEARWAVFFDALGIRWEYEKEGYDLGEAGWYLPDFWLPDLKMWIEVKPTEHQDQKAQDKLSALLNQLNADDDAAESWDVWSSRVYQFNGGMANEDFQITLAHSVLVPVVDFDATRFWGATDYHGDAGVFCIVCGDNYVHLNGFRDMPGGRDNERGGVALDFDCEQGCCFSVQISNWKGSGYAHVISAKSLTSDWRYILTQEQQERYTSAVNAARAARFEHGERP